ncbi:hypothetical protein [Sphingomonas jaspsi]|uniref:hypothetical protein n=1 Tax=Sphingomonas jaspsi TaxID=392409 RepID=UPI0012EBDC20|nr:hypothetical protein [Sphingomonas jaspsi]
MLEDARESAALENATFDGVGNPEGTVIVIRHPNGRETEFKGSVTDFIRQRVKLHHGSWIIGPLNMVLDWSMSTDDGSMDEWDLAGRLASQWPNPAVIAEAKAEFERLTAENHELHAFKRKVLEGLAIFNESVPG